MPVSLEAIKFNHDPTFKTTGAFNIRRNETQTVTVPEWQPNTCLEPECSSVAYAISKLPQTITIQARFSYSDLSATQIKVRAVPVNRDTSASVGPPPANILGNVHERDVPLKRGQSAFEIFCLGDPRVAEAGASVSDTVWVWQFSLDSQDWKDFQITRHRIYVVPDMPKGPWEPRSADPLNIQVPWTEILEYACHWAAGVTKDLDLAASMITKRVYGLGKVLVGYSSGPTYAINKFRATAFLALLTTGIGGGQTLNCDDCATIVSTFANVLGCDLSQSSMGLIFYTNPILLIGESSWRETKFFYHSVAWKGDCLERDALFDSCIQVDSDSKPQSPPQLALQPVNLRFGAKRDKAYQTFLVKASSRCAPIPNDINYFKQRRPIGFGYLGAKEFKASETQPRPLPLRSDRNRIAYSPL